MQKYLLVVLLAWGLCLSPCAALIAAAQETDSRIVGGEPAAPGAWPFMAGLVRSDNKDGFASQFCGASLVGSEWVLTAAHCLHDGFGFVLDTSDLQVLVGAYRLSETTPADRYSVDRLYVHEDYESSTFNNDIGLLHLTESVPDQIVAVVAQNDPGQLITAGNKGYAIGWGNTSSEGSAFPDQLLQVELPIVAQQTLVDAYAALNSVVTDNMFGAGFAAGGKDACQGDSGGPFLMQNAADEWVQTGITSWGIGCAQPNQYGVYTRLSNYNDWIDARIAGYTPDVDDSSGGGCVFTTASGFDAAWLLLFLGASTLLFRRTMSAVRPQ